MPYQPRDENSFAPAKKLTGEGARLSTTLQLAHLRQEFAVRPRLSQALDQQLHGFDRGQRIQHLAQHPDALQILFGNQQLFLTRARALDINCRESPLIHQFAIQDDFRVACALEFFKDHVVHTRTGVDECSGDDGKRAAFFDVAGRSKETLWTLQRVRIDAAREYLARGRNDGVISACQARDRIEQDDHIAFVLDQSLSFFNYHFRDLHVPGGGLVEGRGDDFALDRALHVGDFFRALVDQQHHQHDFRVIRSIRVCHVLQQHGFAGARRRDNEAALSLAERREQVHDARADILARGFKLQALLRIQRRQVVEQNLVAGLVGRLEIDRLDFDERKIFLALMGRAHLAADGVAGFQVELADLRWRHVNVVRPGQVVVVGRAQEAVAVREDLQHTLGEDVSFFFTLCLQDLEDEILFAESAGAGQLQGSGDLGQLGNVFFFEFCNGHIYLRGFSFSGGIVFFSRGGWIALPPCGHTAEPLKQLAVVLRQSSRVRLGCHDVPHRRSCQIHRSWFPECGCSAYETCALPWRPVGKAYTGSAMYVERQIHDQSAFSFFLLQLGIIWTTMPSSTG